MNFSSFFESIVVLLLHFLGPSTNENSIYYKGIFEIVRENYLHGVKLLKITEFSRLTDCSLYCQRLEYCHVIGLERYSVAGGKKCYLFGKDWVNPKLHYKLNNSLEYLRKSKVSFPVTLKILNLVKFHSMKCMYKSA